ncbi:MAG: divalent-cation tolerance protein CutA [Acidobacteriota bacterium]|nr:divalent-cation tolerance protein CutA [Acidobacteriota bacterium]MDH3528139.1 divalent-cation tolerance protein CutA [Acidobacteriota bacterium]
MFIVLTTCGSRKEAERLAREAVSRKLAGCVQILPQIESFYEWKGKISNDKELLLVCKTTREKYPSLERFLSQEHSYDVPEIVAIESSKVSESYHEWLKGVLAG